MFRWLSKKEIVSILSIFLLIGIFFVVKPAEAGAIGNAVAKVIGWIVYALVYVIGLLLMLVMWVLIKVAQFNDFINAEPVVMGWGIVRDLCNMFFILILLIIAFATILQIEQYSFKKMLPKLIIMAVLINFSKTICGIIIDFAQVIMLTFVNGFKDIGAGNLTNMLGIDKLMSLSPGPTDSGGDVSLWSVVGSYMLALLYATISLIVVIIMLSVLVMRMIMMWVYIVLSPLAYLLAAVPGGQKYSGQWWDEFSKNVIIGPVLAFFIWLSFASLGGVEEPSVVANIKSINESQQSGAEGQLSTTTGPAAGITQAGSPDHMIKFIISIAMLLGGLMISQQIGGQAGAIAGKGMQKMQKMGASAAKSLGTGLKRATGVERVQMAYKSYKDMKSSERTQRAREDAMRANEAIGKAKKTVAKPFNYLEDRVSTRIASLRGGKKLKAAEEEMSNIKQTRDDEIKKNDNEVKLKQDAIKNIDEGKFTPEMAEAELRDLQEREAQGQILTNAETARMATLETAISNPEGAIAQDVADDYIASGQAPALRDQILAEINDLKGKKAEIEIEAKVNIDAKQEEIDKLVKKQDKVKKWVSRGMAASLGVAGAGLALTGIGTPAAFGMVTASAGAVTGLIAKKNLKNAGRDNLRRAANYNSQKIDTKKTELKNANKEKLLETINNSSDHHERAAATMIAMERGNVFADSSEAGRHRDDLAHKFRKDDRVQTMLDNSAAKYYPEHSRPMVDLKSDNPIKVDDASKEISSNLNHGLTKISDLSSEAINEIIEEIVATMKDKTFQTQFDSASDENKSAVKSALNREIFSAGKRFEAATDPGEKTEHSEHLYKARKKLAYADSYNIDSFGPSSDLTKDSHKVSKEHKVKYMAEIKADELNKALVNPANNASLFKEIANRIQQETTLNNASTDDEVAEELHKFFKSAGLKSGSSGSKAIIKLVRKNVPTINTP